MFKKCEFKLQEGAEMGCSTSPGNGEPVMRRDWKIVVWFIQKYGDWYCDGLEMPQGGK